MINLAADLGGVSPQENRDDLYLEPIELVSTVSHERDLDPWDDSVADTQPHDESIPLTDEHLDIKTELDSLITALDAAMPHSPHLDAASESGSISGILAKISTPKSVTHTQELLQELNVTRQQLTIARTELQVLHQRNQVQIDRADANIRQAKQLKSRTQQLAHYSKDRVEKVRKMLDEIDRIRTEIVTNLDKFGGYEEIHQMLAQLETTRHDLVIAHERVTTGQAAFYESLQVIQQQVTARSHDSENKLSQYQESIQSLSQTISIDRLRIAGMSVDLSTKINNLHDLNAQITTIYAQIVDKSQTLQSRMNELDRGFGELSQSMRVEQEQFYELTVESIEKADILQSQLAGIVKQISEDRDSIDTIATEIGSIRQAANLQFHDFNLRESELMAICNDFQARQKDWAVTARKFSTWLWVLSLAIGAIAILSIRILVGWK